MMKAGNNTGRLKWSGAVRLGAVAAVWWLATGASTAVAHVPFATMWWTENSTGKLFRANLDGSGVEEFVDFGTNSSGLEIDADGGKVYWATRNPDGIVRANLDGSDVETIVSMARSNDVALDSVNGKIYWGDILSGQIRRANLDGSSVESKIG